MPFFLIHGNRVRPPDDVTERAVVEKRLARQVVDLTRDARTDEGRIEVTDMIRREHARAVRNIFQSDHLQRPENGGESFLRAVIKREVVRIPRFQGHVRISDVSR